MDALDRIEPVARRLLRDVDVALATSGAPAQHPIWPLLRRLGVTPAAAVEFFAQARPGLLASAGGAMREQAGGYRAAAIPTGLAWQGAAGEQYAARVRSLNEHLIGGGPQSLLSLAIATASYVDQIAGWLGRSRDHLAAALAAVLTSTQAVVLAGGVPEPTRAAAAVRAAADIGAYLLEAVSDAVQWGEEIYDRHRDLVDVATPPTSTESAAGRLDATIRLHH